VLKIIVNQKAKSNLRSETKISLNEVNRIIFFVLSNNVALKMVKLFLNAQ